MPYSSSLLVLRRHSVLPVFPFLKTITATFALLAGLACEYVNAAMPGKIGQELGPKISMSEGVYRNEEAAVVDTKEPEVTELSKEAAAASISGSPWPGVIDHLLQRPLPDEDIHPGTASIHINYPSLGIKDIDADIRDWVTGIADAFQSHLDVASMPTEQMDVDQDLALNFLDDPIAPESESTGAFELWGSYKVSRPSDAAVSISFELWNYTGSPHGNLDIIILNYSLLTGQRLNFVDLFEKADLALELMSSWSRKQLEPRLGAARRARMLHDGTEPLAENFANLTLTPEGICINFQPYQVAPWDAGIQTVLMPLEELLAASPLLALWGK